MQHKFDMIINAMSKIVLQVLIWSNLALRALCCSQFTFDHLLQLKLALRAYSFYSIILISVVHWHQILATMLGLP